MAEFTPISAAIGGALIGIAATLLMLFTGAGVSGIIAGCLRSPLDDMSWRVAFIAGLLLAPLAARVRAYPMPLPQMPANLPRASTVASPGRVNP